MRALAILLLLLPCASAGGGRDPATAAPADRIRAGIASPALGVRREAAERARELARTDPGFLDEIWAELDGRGRAVLVRAVAGAGTKHAAMVALGRAHDAEPEVFRALLRGLVDGGLRALATPLPEGLPKERRDAVERLRMRWRVEAELVRLQSPSGPTGYYAGQFDRLQPIAREALPVLFDILTDRSTPLPGEAGTKPYEPIHPEMATYDPRDLREMVANGFGQLIDRADMESIARLYGIWARYWAEDADEEPFLKEDLAPNIAFSLHDLGLENPARQWIANRRREVALGRRPVSAAWSLGYAYIRIGEYEAGVDWYRRVFEYDWGSKSVAAYNLACHFSMMAQREPDRAELHRAQAVRWLRDAVESYNFVDWQWMEEDRDLDAIRKEPEYQRLLAGLKKRYPDWRKQKVEKDIDKILEEPR